MYTINFNKYMCRLRFFSQFPVSDHAIKLFFFFSFCCKTRGSTHTHTKIVSVIQINSFHTHPFTIKKSYILVSIDFIRNPLDIFRKCTLFVIHQVYSSTVSKYMPLFPEATGQATGVLPNISRGHT